MSVVWTTPHDWSAGELVTAVLMDIHVRDNTDFLGTPPSVRAYRTTNQSINSATQTAVVFDAERYDDVPSGYTQNQHTTTSRLTCRVAGKYIITTSLSWAANTTGTRVAQLQINGTTNIASDSRPAAATGGAGTDQTLTTLYELAVNDFVELIVSQDSGGALNVLTSGNFSPELAWQWVGF